MSFGGRGHVPSPLLRTAKPPDKHDVETFQITREIDPHAG